jgi:LPS-assembly protein
VFGPDLFRTVVSYIDIPPTNPADPTQTIERELFTAISTKISRYWALTASHRQNLGPGGGAIRTDFGATYEDECFVFSLTVAKDNTSDRDFKSGMGVLLRFSFKTIGDLRLNTDVGSR